MPMIQNSFLFCALTLLVACSASSGDAKETASSSSNGVQLGVAKVTLEGKTQTMDIWRKPCGFVDENNSFVIWAGRYNRDDPQKSERNLNLGGKAGDERHLCVDYMPDAKDSRTVVVRVDGAEAPEMTGTTLNWSGETLSGASISIEAECP